MFHSWLLHGKTCSSFLKRKTGEFLTTKTINMEQKLMFLVIIAGQYLLLNELQYEKYLIYGATKL